MGLFKINSKTFSMSTQEVILGVLFIVYFILGYPIPEPVANQLDTLIGQVSVFAVVFILFISSNPIIGVIGLLVAIDIIRRSRETTGSDAIAKYLPSESSKMSEFNAYNQFPITLEQEIVKLRTVNQKMQLPPASFKPILENDYNASPVSTTII